MKIKIKPDFKGLWLGISWNKTRVTTLDTDTEHYRVWIAIIPFLPVIIEYAKRIPASKRHINW